ncbi:hypothetical protein [Colwellia sp. 12G3]|uniref:hypothetical protein n=1 Tax=Colwellia sp. 12G3 TaxID=2058299 RepID=UPI000C349545|nr:hypothetical protein [Colwellia sp. 12G3]PKI13935.1 hypothetical protein CXF71_15205 [Colwellia sp. 12G3]
MDKIPGQNENTVPVVEPNKLETEHGVVVKTKSIDVHSLPQKKRLLESEKDSKSPPLDKQPLDESWLLLSQDWQSQPYEKTDIPALLKQTKKRTLLAKSLLVIDVIATLGLIIALLVVLYQGGWGTATIAYLAFGSIMSVAFVYYEIKIRLRIWQQSCDSPDKAVANAIAGVKSSISYIKLIKLSCWLLLPVVNWYVYVMIEESEKSPWPPFFAINTFIIIMWLITHWFHKKRARELSQLTAV